MATEEKLLTPLEVARRFPGRGAKGHVHPATVVRLIVNGSRGADGVRRRLPARRVGSMWLVSPAELDAFIRDQGTVGHAESQPITASQRKAQDEADNAKLKQLLAK